VIQEPGYYNRESVIQLINVYLRGVHDSISTDIISSTGYDDTVEVYMQNIMNTMSVDAKYYMNLITATIMDSIEVDTNAYGVDTTLITRLSQVESSIINANLDSSDAVYPLIYVAVSKHSAALIN
jgi:hypothetical protein